MLTLFSAIPWVLVANRFHHPLPPPLLPHHLLLPVTNKQQGEKWKLYYIFCLLPTAPQEVPPAWLTTQLELSVSSYSNITVPSEEVSYAVYPVVSKT